MATVDFATTPTSGNVTRLDAIQLHYCAENALSRALHELRSDATSYRMAEGHALDALRAVQALAATSGRA